MQHTEPCCYSKEDHSYIACILQIVFFSGQLALASKKSFDLLMLLDAKGVGKVSF